MNVKKIIVDTTLALLLVVAVIVITGFILHNEVHHLFIYNNTFLWTLHEVTGLLLIIALVLHSVQHSFWFKHYRKLKPEKRRVTTILLADGILVAISGVFLMFGSRSHFVSIFHYVTGILFTLLAIGHVAKRWTIFRALFQSSRA